MGSNLWGKEGLSRFIPSLDLTHVGTSAIESVLFFFLSFWVKGWRGLWMINLVHIGSCRMVNGYKG